MVRASVGLKCWPMGGPEWPGVQPGPVGRHAQASACFGFGICQSEFSSQQLEYSSQELERTVEEDP